MTNSQRCDTLFLVVYNYIIFQSLPTTPRFLDNKLQNRIIQALRKINRNYWGPRKAAKLKCKVNKALYKCEECGVLVYEGKSAVSYFNYVEMYAPKEVRMERFDMDHTQPVVDPAVGFVDWNTYMDRLFCPEENWKGLCSEVCHKAKTKAETKVRWAKKYGDKK